MASPVPPVWISAEPAEFRRSKNGPYCKFAECADADEYLLSGHWYCFAVNRSRTVYRGRKTAKKAAVCRDNPPFSESFSSVSFHPSTCYFQIDSLRQLHVPCFSGSYLYHVCGAMSRRKTILRWIKITESGKVRKWKSGYNACYVIVLQQDRLFSGRWERNRLFYPAWRRLSRTDISLFLSSV